MDKNILAKLPRTTLAQPPVETVYGQVVDEKPRRPKIDVNVNHKHTGQIGINTTHLTGAFINNQRREQSQRREDGRWLAQRIYDAVCAALSSKQDEIATLAVDVSQSEQPTEVKVDRSCTDHGDWSEYGYLG